MSAKSSPLKFPVVLLAFLLLSASHFTASEVEVFPKETTKPVVKVKEKIQKNTSEQQSEFNKLLEEAKRLYLQEMDNEGALQKLTEAEGLAQSQQEKADVNFYLSLVYYALWGRGGSENFAEMMRNISLIDETIRKLIVFDYYRAMDRFICPPKYLEAFEAVKKDYGALKIQSSPAGADVLLGDSPIVVGKTPLTIGHKEGNVMVRVRMGKREKQSALHVTAGQEKESPLYSLKKRSSLIYWLGGAALAGGTAALLLIKKKEPSEPAGSIHVYSSPEGAAVFLNDINTGQVTNCTLTDVSVGAHTLKIVKEGFKDETREVVVEDGQITTVNVTLTKFKLKITQPTSDSVWINGEDVEITWETEEESTAGMAFNFRSTGINIPGVKINSPFSNQRYRTQVQYFGTTSDAGQNSIRHFVDPGSIESALKTDRHLEKNRRSLIYNPDIPSINLDLLHSWQKSLEGSERSDFRSHFRRNRFEQNESAHFSVQAFSSVKIELNKGGGLINTLSGSAENTGSFTWTVTDFLQEGVDYSIKISCQGEPSIVDETDSFMISYSYSFLTKWGSEGNGPNQFKMPSGIDVAGHVYVVDQFNNRIQKFNSDGAFIKQWGEAGTGNGQFLQPFGITVDPYGHVYVVDSENCRIQKFDSNGIFLTKWGSHGSEEGQFSNPYDVTVDDNGNVYVVELGNNRVQKFTSDGAYITQWGSQGSGDGQFNEAVSIDLDKAGFVYVADYMNHRIQKFSPDGVFLDKWGEYGYEVDALNHPHGIFIDQNGFAFISGSGLNRIQKFTTEGKHITGWGGAGSGDGQIINPLAIALDESGNVYVCDSGNNRIQKFGPNKVQSLNKK